MKLPVHRPALLPPKRRNILTSSTRELANLIRDLYREKDETCNNYAEETKKTSRFEAQLVVAEDMALTARAQLVTANVRVASQLLIEKPFFWSNVDFFLTFACFIFPALES